MAHYELIVIGAGPGGYEAALHAAKLGKRSPSSRSAKRAAPA